MQPWNEDLFFGLFLFSSHSFVQYTFHSFCKNIVLPLISVSRLFAKIHSLLVTSCSIILYLPPSLLWRCFYTPGRQFITHSKCRYEIPKDKRRKGDQETKGDFQCYRRLHHQVSCISVIAHFIDISNVTINITWEIAILDESRSYKCSSTAGRAHQQIYVELKTSQNFMIKKNMMRNICTGFHLVAFM